MISLQTIGATSIKSRNDMPALTPEEYSGLYLSQQRPPAADGKATGVIGRFIRGVKEEDFVLLSEEPGKKLTWVRSNVILPFHGRPSMSSQFESDSHERLGRESTESFLRPGVERHACGCPPAAMRTIYYLADT
jgi:hypothetical protein